MWDISDDHILSVVKSSRLDRPNLKRETLYITTTATASGSEAIEGVASATSHVPDNATSEVLLDERCLIRALRDLQKLADAVWVEDPLVVRFVIRHDARSIAKTEAFKLSKLIKWVTSIIPRDSSICCGSKACKKLLLCIWKRTRHVLSCSTEGEHCWKHDFSNFQTGGSHQVCQRYIWVAKFLLHHLNILNIVKNFEEKKTGSRTLSIQHLDDRTMFPSSWKEGPHLAQALITLVQKPIMHQLSHAPFIYISGAEQVLSARYPVFTKNATLTAALPFLHCSLQPLPQTRL